MRLRNDGDEALSVSDLAASDDAFRLTHDCKAPLAKGDSCSAAIVFVPPAPGPRKGTLKIATNAGSREIALSGDARALPPLDLGAVDLGSAVLGAPRRPQRVRFANGSPIPVSFGEPIVSPPFTVAGNRCRDVPPGGFCDVFVALPSNVVGAFKGDLRLVDRGGNAVAFSTLGGATTSPPIENSPAKIGIAKRERNIIVTNLSGRPVAVDITTEGLPGIFVVDPKPCSKVYQANERCVITVSTRPVLTHVPVSSLRLVVRYEGNTQFVPIR